MPPTTNVPTTTRLLLRVAEAAEALAISRTALYGMLRSGEIGTIHTGRRAAPGDDAGRRSRDGISPETSVVPITPVHSSGLSVRSERSGDYPNLYTQENLRAERPDAR